ncbi:hypothetical protein H0H93_001360 [Arthromyces matolae]|nr:hypothetical protein H0H93_001360 [Arthromyces matolae]
MLRSVSQWAQKNVESLRSQSPPLDPNAYSMVALLAGTMTSPERNFGAYQQPQDPEEIAAVKIAERKSITAIFNGLLSIFGVGFAVWWAADKLGWKNEWRVLLALFAAIVVAIAEAALYLIWQSRLERSKSKRTKPRHQIRRRPKKDDHPTGGPEPSSNNQHRTISTSVEEVTDAGLRRRQ